MAEDDVQDIEHKVVGGPLSTEAVKEYFEALIRHRGEIATILSVEGHKTVLQPKSQWLVDEQGHQKAQALLHLMKELVEGLEFRDEQKQKVVAYHHRHRRQAE